MAWAQASNNADILGTKAYLESLLVQRFSNELATQVDESQFEISAKIDVSRVTPKIEKPTENSNYTDLELGFLDPEKLLSQNQENQLSHFLRSYRIRKVNVQAGLSSDLSEDVKKRVETWLTARVKQEFGKTGTSQVQFIQKPLAHTQLPQIKTFFEKVKDLQGLAGQAVMALAILMGALIFAVLNRPKDASGSEPSAAVNVNNTFENEGVGAGAAVAAGAMVPGETTANESKKKLISSLGDQIRDIAPKVSKEIDSIVKEWCRAGEAGFEQVACFAEVVGQTIGRVPIPNEFRQDVTDVFGKMYEMTPDEKLNILNQVYWDLMAVLNLGTESLHKPFSFLGSASTTMTQKVLMENTPEIQAVAAYYMPKKQRKSYFNSLGETQKMELLKEASSLDKLKYADLESMESHVAPAFADDSNEKVVILSKSLQSLIEVMSYKEAILLLKDMDGPVLLDYKKTHPSLAFLHDWPDESFNLLIQQAGQEEIMALVSVRPDLKDRVFQGLPPRMRQILEDDFSNIENMKESDQEKFLQNLHMQLVLFVDNGYVDLPSVFSIELQAVADDSAA